MFWERNETFWKQNALLFWEQKTLYAEHLINIQGKLSKKGMIDDPLIFLKLLVFLTSTGTRMMNGLDILSSSCTPDALSCKSSSNSKLTCRSKQFHNKSPDI